MTETVSWKSPDGLDLFARRYGPSNAPLSVLCMHGLTRNHKDFEPMIAKLGERHQFISVDVRGRGNSARDPVPEHYSPAVYAGDMVALLDHLNLQKVALIGTSMGGLMSMILMKSIPERIRGVVLNDVGPMLDKAGLERIASYVGNVAPVRTWEEAAAAVEDVQGDLFPDFTHDDWMAFARRTYRETESGEVVLDYDPEITRTVGQVKPSLRTRIAMWQLFKSMKAAPLLIIRGQMSDILSEKTANKMLKRHPDAVLVNVPRVGHAPLLDEPEAVEAIRAFLIRLETLA